MKNHMTVMFFFIFLLCIVFVFGMDNYSEEKQELTHEEEPINLADYIKQEKEQEKTVENYDIKNELGNLYFNLQMDVYNPNILTFTLNEAEKNSKNFNDHNELKRKHKLEKFCEYCEQKSVSGRLYNSKISDNALCPSCYYYERRYGKLIPRYSSKRRKHDNILVCEFCQKESKLFTTSKVSGKSLCRVCYRYEYRYGKPVPLDKRKKFCNVKHNHIRVCEFCQHKSVRYKTGKVSGKSLCTTCYGYESKHGQLIPRDERKKTLHKNTILVCEFCQKESAYFITGKVSGKSLCHVCYLYESRTGHLIPLDERKRNQQKYFRKSPLSILIDAENY